ncbi:hypothetical protein ACFYYS_06650 [Streptomyces sp. NPDC002120]|uniref:hypothetical protein n=1 Tax=Streptomyces sp. NPDC002120 TaxID=3364631 RepID=UPI00368207D2
MDARASGGHVALVGVWDPVSDAQAAFFRDTVSDAQGKGLSVLVVTLDPDPVAVFRGPQIRPPFQDVEYRLWFQAQCGVQSRLVVSLSRWEVEQEGASLILNGLRRHVTIDEFLLRKGQSLGRGIRGGASTIHRYCDRLGIRVAVTDRYRAPVRVNDARDHLRRGELSPARELLSQDFYCARPESAERTMSWPPGTYKALPLDVPMRHHAADRAPIELPLTPCRGGSRLRWPDGSPPWLAFVSGPGDRPHVPEGQPTRGRL